MPLFLNKHLGLFLLIIALPILTFAQNGAKGKNDNYDNWIVDLSQSRSSYAGIRLDKVELNFQYTIVHMSFFNRSWSQQLIEACNSFHIRSKGKRVAHFIKAEGIPTRDVYRTGFSCADERTAMTVKSGQLVRFKLYFSRIPTFLNNIDIIEYNGFEECEFDVFNLNISEKKPLPPNTLAQSKPKPKQEVIKPEVKKDTPKPPVKTQKKDEPLIATKSVPAPSSPKKTAESSAKKDTLANKPDMMVFENKSNPARVISPEKREVKVKKEFILSQKTLQIEIWDNDQEDGDMVSIMLNNRWILRGVKVTKNKMKIEIPLIEGENKLVFHADNLGTSPPNTAALSFNDGMDYQTIILNSNFDKSEAVRIIRK